MRFNEDKMDKFAVKDGTSFDIHIWESENAKAVIIGLHGGLAHAGDFVTPALYFKKYNFTTVAYDLRGHKQKRVYINSFDDFVDDTIKFIEWTKTHYANLPIFIMGHSIGSLIATFVGLKIDDPIIKGYIKSSPYYENKVKVSPILIKLSGLLAKIMPKGKAPIENITDHLTRDENITKRHLADEKMGIRATEVSIKFGKELLDTQNNVKLNIKNWNHPVFYIIAGKDRLTDYQTSLDLIKSIKPDIVRSEFYPENYHENFNEINREEIYLQINNWMEERLKN